LKRLLRRSARRSRQRSRPKLLLLARRHGRLGSATWSKRRQQLTRLAPLVSSHGALPRPPPGRGRQKSPRRLESRPRRESVSRRAGGA